MKQYIIVQLTLGANAVRLRKALVFQVVITAVLFFSSGTGLSEDLSIDQLESQLGELESGTIDTAEAADQFESTGDTQGIEEISESVNQPTEPSATAENIQTNEPSVFDQSPESLETPEVVESDQNIEQLDQTIQQEQVQVEAPPQEKTLLDDKELMEQISQGEKEVFEQEAEQVLETAEKIDSPDQAVQREISSVEKTTEPTLANEAAQPVETSVFDEPAEVEKLSQEPEIVQTEEVQAQDLEKLDQVIEKEQAQVEQPAEDNLLENKNLEELAGGDKELFEQSAEKILETAENIGGPNAAAVAVQEPAAVKADVDFSPQEAEKAVEKSSLETAQEEIAKKPEPEPEKVVEKVVEKVAEPEVLPTQQVVAATPKAEPTVVEEMGLSENTNEALKQLQELGEDRSDFEKFELNAASLVQAIDQYEKTGNANRLVEAKENVGETDQSFTQKLAVLQAQAEKDGRSIWGSRAPAAVAKSGSDFSAGELANKKLANSKRRKEEAIKLYAKGMLAFESESFDESANTFALFLQRYSTHKLRPSAQYYLAESYLRAGKYDIAKEQFQQFLTTHSKSGHTTAARARLKRSDFDTLESTKWSFGVELGVRYMFHYNQQQTLTTPPESFQGEVSGYVWYRNRISGYLLYGQGVTGGNTITVGPGFKYRLFSFGENPNNFISRLTFLVASDVLYYHTRAPQGEESYSNSGLIFRYGLGTHWRFYESPYYLNTTMMVTTMSDNFFLSPVISGGYRF